MVILSIDDDFDDREFFCDAIKAIDPQILCIQANSGHSGLVRLKADEALPDFLFIDINMPKVNGFECVRAIRSDIKLKGLRIVMYSTSFNPNDLIKFQRF